MGLTINYGSQYRTKEVKGNIPAHVMVTCQRVIDWNTNTGIFTDKNGNENEYHAESELIGFGYIKNTTGIFDIVEDYYRKTDKNGNKDFLYGRTHITKNIRGSKDYFRFGEDCLYAGDASNGYDYVYRELTDQEVIDMILEEIIYGVRPDLDGTSCVGTTAKGIDKDPNYHDGHYYLPNHKDYTVTWCYGTIKIREGIDGGWYQGKKEVGRQIYEGSMDWERYKTAKIKKAALAKLKSTKIILEDYPEVIDFIAEKIKSDTKFKLNHEFAEDEQ